MYRRLGGLALVYAGAWLANFVYFRLAGAAFGEHERDRFWEIATTLCVVMAITVYVLCRTRRIPARLFTNFAMTFEVVGAIGIASGFFGWEHYHAELVNRIGEALGIARDMNHERFVEPLNRAHLRVVGFEGVTWVSVWLLVFPLVVPTRTTVTVITTLLTAATVPGVMVASRWINGTPESIRAWLDVFLVECTVPTFICAGMAILGSRVTYSLTSALSKAQRMGSYELVERIGTGGMGEVWKAKHERLARPAAIKLIRPEMLGASSEIARTAIQRFEREAQSTAELCSPHSVALFDFGVTEEGVFYYVMELLEGIDLKTAVERYGPMPAERAIHVLQQCCHSLTDAHAIGVIHRDIKPANILICRYGSDHDFVKILDFGLVKQLGDAGTVGSQLTAEGVTTGTPAFMAPEMALDNRNVDARADIYALGCVGYWLLTGRLVFEGDSPMAVLLMHAKDAPLPPSRRTEREVPAGLEELILACLEKDRDKRPQSAQDVSVQLAACAAELPPWTPERARLWWHTYLPNLAR